MGTGNDQSTIRLFFTAVTEEIFMELKGYLSVDKCYGSLIAAIPLENTGIGRLLCWHSYSVFLTYKIVSIISVYLYLFVD